MITIYRSPDSRWLEACAWAKQNNVPVTMINERCFRGINRRSTLFYSDAENIISDYAVAGIRRLTDGVIDGD